jgi:hypothetical protein
MEAIGSFLERFAALPNAIIVAFFVVLAVVIGGPKFVEKIIGGIERKVAVLWEMAGEGVREFIKWCGLVFLGFVVMLAFLGVGQNSCHSGSVDCDVYEER